jgi:hypothetical protein
MPRRTGELADSVEVDQTHGGTVVTLVKQVPDGR